MTPGLGTSDPCLENLRGKDGPAGCSDGHGALGSLPCRVWEGRARGGVSHGAQMGHQGVGNGLEPF